MRKLALGVVLLALAGCGGGNGAGDTGDGDTGAATTDIPRTGTISDEVLTGTDGETEVETEDD